MEDERKVIAIEGFDDFGSVWRMRLDLTAVAESAGVYDVAEVDGRRYRDLLLKMSQARKICRLVLDLGTDSDIAAADEAFKKNPKLLKVWGEEKRRRGR